jgi:K+-sensing histidine kinase KdpD
MGIRADREADSVSYPSLLRYGIAVVSVAVALGLKLLLDALLMQDDFLLLIFGAIMLSLSIMLSAWYGGLGPGILATALSALIIDYFFFTRYAPFRVSAWKPHRWLRSFLKGYWSARWPRR